MMRFLLTVAVLVAGALPVLVASEAVAEHPRNDRYGDPLPKGAIARLGTLRLRDCRGPVVFSPDGKYLVAAGGEDGKQVVFWDIGTGRRVKALTANGYILGLVFSPDGKQLAASAYFGDFGSLWDVATGKQRFPFTGQTVAFSADGKKLISTWGFSEKTTLRAYDTGDGKQQTEWSLVHPHPDSFTLSADGQFAAAPSGGDKSSISVFDLRKKVEAKKLPVKVGRVHGGGFSRDGRRLVASGENGWATWDWKSGKSLRLWSGRIHDTPPAFSPDGRRLAWVGAEEDRPGVVSLWVVDLDGGQPRRLGVTKSIGWQHSPAFSDDGKKLAVVTEGNAVVLVDSRTGRDLLRLDAHSGGVESVAYFSDNRYVITRDSFRVLVWEVATGRLLRRLPDDLPAGETVLLNTASHGRILTAELPDGILRLRDLVTGKQLRRLKGKNGFVSAAPWDVSEVSSDGTSAAILGPNGVRIYDLDTGDIRSQFTPEHAIWDMKFSADGRTLVVTIQDYQKGLLTIYHDTQTGGKAELPATPSSRTNTNGRWRESGEEAKIRLQKLKLLDAAGGPAFANADEMISNVYESPGGRYLAVQGGVGRSQAPGDRDKSFLRLWNTATRRLVTELDGKQGTHRIVGFSADTQTFISTTHWPGTIYLWETATGRERLRLVGHMAGDVRLCFRADGRVLVSGGADTQVFLWDVTGRTPDGVRHMTRHSSEQLRALWKALASDDAMEAYRAVWALVDAPAQTVTWMREHLPPIAPVEPRQLARLIADLDSDEFTVRSKATEELERLGELAELALRGALAGRPTLECRRRCEGLIEKLAVLSPQRLRTVRAVEVLEHLGTAEARALLEKWRQGAPQARLTQEASAALARLAASPAVAP